VTKEAESNVVPADLEEMKEEARQLSHDVSLLMNRKSSNICIVTVFNILEMIFSEAPSKEQRDGVLLELEKFIFHLRHKDWTETDKCHEVLDSN